MPIEISDEEALPIIFDLLEHEGLCMGGSTGINVAGAIRMAQDMGPGHTIVTMLCDYGTRYQSKLFNPGIPEMERDCRRRPGWRKSATPIPVPFEIMRPPFPLFPPNGLANIWTRRMCAWPMPPGTCPRQARMRKAEYRRRPIFPARCSSISTTCRTKPPPCRICWPGARKFASRDAAHGHGRRQSGSGL